MVAISFEEFYRSEWVSTVRLAHLLTGSSAAADDLAQDALLRVRKHYHRTSAPVAFLRTVTVNVCRNWQRGEIRHRQRNLRAVGPTSSVMSPELDDMLDAVDQLPFRQRSVIVLRFWLDMNEADIAECIGCRPGTVKSLSSRALATLRSKVEP